MVFKKIRENLLKKKTYHQMAKYLTHKNTIEMVAKFLDEKNSLCIDVTIILESYLIRYNAEKMLFDTELDDELLSNILLLHKDLENEELSSDELNKSLIDFESIYFKWYDMDEKRVIDNLVNEYYLINIEKNKKDIGEDKLKTLEYSQEDIKKKIFSIGGDEAINKIDGNLPEINNKITELIAKLEKSYCDKIRQSIISGDMDIVTKNLKDMRGLLLLCTQDENFKSEMMDNLYIEYMSDEEIYKYIDKLLDYVVKIDKTLDEQVKEAKKQLQYNVIRNNEMENFLPELIDETYTYIEKILIKKRVNKNKITTINSFFNFVKNMK